MSVTNQPIAAHCHCEESDDIRTSKAINQKKAPAEMAGVFHFL